jgi:hypothetical protein
MEGEATDGAEPAPDRPIDPRAVRLTFTDRLEAAWRRSRAVFKAAVDPVRGDRNPRSFIGGAEDAEAGGAACREADGSGLPRVIWMLWLQGWDRAPELVLACAETWRRCNPTWQVRLEDATTLADVLPASAFDHVTGKSLEHEAFSDVVRLELLARYGGVWADATTYCLEPLDDWLVPRMSAGFFAFARPVPDRILASWFLAAVQGSVVVQRWREATRDYWATRTSRDHYFWVHRLFAACHARHPDFRSAWDAVPTLSAVGPHRFQPYATRLAARVTAADEAFLSAPDEPVLKLTHHRPAVESEAASLARRLCDRAWSRGRHAATAAPRPEVLVAWYGSFAGHGTIGDLLSLESVVTRLAGEGWRVSHASAADVVIPGAPRVDWEQVDPARFAAVVFACGPIIAGHPQTEALFSRFRDRPLLGVGVSLFDPCHELHANPFTAVLARQGGMARFEDVALVAPQPVIPRPDGARRGLVIGMALRGSQTEYGAANCLSERVGRLAWAAAERLLARTGGRVLPIENHLARSGRTPRGIEAGYAACDLVITSRFHGAMLALRHGVPFVALDQIRGGGKVAPLLEGRGWPHVLRVDDVDAAGVTRAAVAALAPEARLALRLARDRAVMDAAVTLHAMTTWLQRRCEGPCRSVASAA